MGVSSVAEGMEEEEEDDVDLWGAGIPAIITLTGSCAPISFSGSLSSFLVDFAGLTDNPAILLTRAWSCSCPSTRYLSVKRGAADSKAGGDGGEGGGGGRGGRGGTIVSS